MNEIVSIKELMVKIMALTCAYGGHVYRLFTKNKEKKNFKDLYESPKKFQILFENLVCNSIIYLSTRVTCSGSSS